MSKFILKRKRMTPLVGKNTETVQIRIDIKSYNKVLELANETGDSLRSILTKMVSYSYENVSFDTAQDDGGAYDVDFESAMFEVFRKYDAAIEAMLKVFKQYKNAKRM